MSSEYEVGLLLDGALNAVIATNQAGVITAWNRHAEKTFGYTRTEALGHTLTELNIPSRPPKAEGTGMEPYLDTASGFILDEPIEVSALHRHGHEVPIELIIIPNGRAGQESFFAIIRDLSAQKELERKLAQRDLELEMMHQTTLLVGQGGSVDDLLRTCLEKICLLAGWSAGHIYRPDNIFSYASPAERHLVLR